MPTGHYIDVCQNATGHYTGDLWLQVDKGFLSTLPPIVNIKEKIGRRPSPKWLKVTAQNVTSSWHLHTIAWTNIAFPIFKRGLHLNSNFRPQFCAESMLGPLLFILRTCPWLLMKLGCSCAELWPVWKEQNSWAAGPQLTHLCTHGLDNAMWRQRFTWKYRSGKPCHKLEWLELKGWKGWSQKEKNNQLLIACIDGSEFLLVEASQRSNCEAFSTLSEAECHLCSVDRTKPQQNPPVPDQHAQLKHHRPSYHLGSSFVCLTSFLWQRPSMDIKGLDITIPSWTTIQCLWPSLRPDHIRMGTKNSGKRLSQLGRKNLGKLAILDVYLWTYGKR